MLDYLVHCNTNPNPIFAMCLMMCCKKSKFKGDPLKFEKINDGSCETRHNVILQMSLCDILKNHPFAITVQPNESPNTKCVSFCVGKNPIWMEESQFFPKNQLCASETLRSPILTPFSTVFWESSITGHSKTRFAPNATMCLVSNAPKFNLHGWPQKFRNNCVGGSVRKKGWIFWMSLCDILKSHYFFTTQDPNALEILK